MRFKLFLIILTLLVFSYGISHAQDQPIAFVKDTMTFTGESKVLEGEYLETTLKNLSVVRMFRSNNNRFYIRFLVTVNFYFDKTDVLEIRSGKKSYYTDKTKQYKVNKALGLFIAEIPRNYIAQLKDEGITSIFFNGAETDFTRHDAGQIKKMARIFYDSIAEKK